MAVRSSHRRKGYGTDLFLRAAEKAQLLWLEVRSKNRAAIDFYERMGMRPVGKVADYYEGDDAVIMVLNKNNRTD